MAHLFISYSRENRELVDRLRKDLERAGLTIWIDKEGLKVGSSNWEQVLRDAIEGASAVLVMVSPSSRRSRYVNAEIAVATSAKKTIYPIFIIGDSWVDSAPFELIMTQALDLRGAAYQQNLPQLLNALQNQNPSSAPPLASTTVVQNLVAPPRNPYKGLRAFRAEDKDDFFGREELVADLLSMIGNGKSIPRIRAVLGASGSGKSSVMMAGVLPKLQSAHPDWIFLDPMVPSSKPIEKLAHVLAKKLPDKSLSTIDQDLRDRSTYGLQRLSALISDKPVILYIDQFEELFTLVSQESERRHFIELLTSAITESDGVLFLLLTMRADFYDRPALYGDFGQIIENHHSLVTPMSLADIFRVVTLPAALPDVQLQFEKNLVTEMVYELRQEDSALPLLQFVLDQLFEQRENYLLSLSKYHAMGGVKGALAKHADEHFDKLPSEQHKRLARFLFLRLIEAGTSEQDTTRRRISASELNLPDIAETRILSEVTQRFITARLLTSNQIGTEQSLELSHEALIRAWKRLGDWLREAREDLPIQKSLQIDVAEWLKKNKAPELLYRGSILVEAQAYAKRNLLSRDETMFLNEALHYETSEKARAKRQAKILRQLSIGLGMTLVLASIGLALIFSQNNAALVAEASTLEAEVATSQFQSDYVSIQVQWSFERDFPIAPAFLTQTPALALFATATAYAASAWEPITETFDGIEMVLVPAGCFYMGSNFGADEQPIHEICFSEAFWLDKTELRQSDFERLHGVKSGLSGVSAANHPVEQITWFEARDFCELRGGRLPTEAEWEYAARGPNSLSYPWGNDFVPENALYSENADNQTVAVGSYPNGRSWVGALDMAGNVMEWTLSRYEPYPYNRNDGREADSDEELSRVLRGGSWGNSELNLSGADRYGVNPTTSSYFIGFRCSRAVR